MASTKSDPSSDAKTFYDEVFSEELKIIQNRRTARDPGSKPGLLNQDLDIDGAILSPQPKKLPRCERDLTALAFSGGGIRSATFNLGLLQGMAKIESLETRKTLLPLFDYLSTVSGGGYIGSWLAGWIRNDGASHVEAELKGKPRELISDTNETNESRQIQHLRSYSNYLTPNLGLFSIDTWSAIATYLRNAFVNQLIIISVIIALLMVPRLVAKFAHAFPFHAEQWYLVAIPVIVVSTLAMLSAILGLSERLTNFHHGWLRWVVALPLFVATVLLLWWPPDAAAWAWWIQFKDWMKSSWVGSILAHVPSAARRGVGWAFAMVAFNLGLFLIYRGDPQSKAVIQRPHIALGVWLCSALMAGFAGGVLLHLFINEFIAQYWHQQAWHVMTWGPGLALLLFVLALHLQLGMRGKYESDLNREWWACMVGWLLIYALLWTFLAAISIFGPLLFKVVGGGAKTEFAAAVTWLLSIVTGILTSRSPKTGDPNNPNWFDRLAKVVAPIAVIGLFLIAAVGLNAFFAWWLGPETPTESCKYLHPTQSAAILAPDNTPRMLTTQPGLNWCGILSDYYASMFERPGLLDLFWVLIAALAIVGVMGGLIDLNQFSMHSFYRNRLVRCYLRAIRKKGACNPNLIHGFDPEDDFPLADLVTNETASSPSSTQEDKAKKQKYDGPYLLINAALNITDPKKLGWQERKASGFILSPKNCGSNVTGYRETRDYADEIKLGTALAISGAAYTSNMGYHSSRPLAFFLSLFNARLGWWIGNPRHDKYTEDGPRWGLYYLLAELFGNANDKRNYVYLSDGGHFDNLGIYELVRRRCRYIVCSDAGEDSLYGFDDLGMAMRKIQADFGIDIDINLDMVKPQTEKGYSLRHVAIGTIRYDKVDRNSPVGMLVYIKASLVGDEPADVLEYKMHHPLFPHETTLDQFFSESQFEAYRHLGEHIGQEVFRYVQQEL